MYPDYVVLDFDHHPFFISVHSIDTHPPFSPPRAGDDVEQLPRARQGEIDRYDASIRFNDSQIRRLQDKLVEKGIMEKTLLIVTADHGEALNDHGKGGHGRTVYDEEIRVPLLMRCML